MNGMWLSIMDSRYTSKEIESEEKELLNDSIIKISDYELKVQNF